MKPFPCCFIKDNVPKWEDDGIAINVGHTITDQPIEAEPHKECPVCLDALDSKHFRLLVPCSHKICTQCMKNFIRVRRDECPICRSHFNMNSHEIYLGIYHKPS